MNRPGLDQGVFLVIGAVFINLPGKAGLPHRDDLPGRIGQDLAKLAQLSRIVRGDNQAHGVILQSSPGRA